MEIQESQITGMQPEPTDGFVPLGAPRRPPTAEGPSEAVNLVPLFSEEEQKKIAETVCNDYDGDVRSRAPRMKRLKEFQGLYASVMKAKSMPFQNCANVNLPVLTTAILQIQGRLYDMVWPANGKIMLCNPTGLNDMARAQIAELFANTYIRLKIPEMGQGLDDTIHQVCGYGSAFRRTYWNAYEGRVCSDWIAIEDFVVAYSQRSQDPSMRDVPRYTMVQHLTYYDIEQYGDRGVYVNTDKVKVEAPPTDGKNDSEFKQQVEKIDGSTQATETTDEDKPRFVLEQHRIWRMPNAPQLHAAFDGKPHAVIITVDDLSKQVLRMVVREEPDPDDLRRFQREQAAYDQHMAALQAHVQEATAAAGVAEAATARGLPLPPDFAPPQPPEPPPGVKMGPEGAPIAPEPQRYREICFFTHYKAFPGEGFYGLGLGDFLAGLNKAVNTMLNQKIDAGTIANAPPGFISANMRGQRGTIELIPGQLLEIDAPMGALKDGIMWMTPPPGDPSTMKIVELLLGLGDKMVASSDLMSGQTSGANRTAAETKILAEQMMMQITVLARRIKEAFRHELDKIWRCWGVFLPDDDTDFDAVGEDGAPQGIKVSRNLFLPDAHVIPAADPRTKSQREESAMQVYMLISNNPYLMAQPPPIKDALMRAATEDVLRAHGAEKFVKLLPPPQPMPPPPPPPAPYWAEDAGFLRGQDHPNHPADNDDEHIQGHTSMLNSPAGSALDKVGRDMAEKHIRGHIAAKIEKAGQAMQQQRPPMMPGPGPMPPGMGA